MTSMSRNQICGILAAITAGFSFINMILVAQIKGTFFVFTAVVLACTIISGTASAIMIFVKSQDELNDAFVLIAKITIIIAISLQFFTAVEIRTYSATLSQINTGSKIPNAVLAMSIIYLILAAAGLGALFIWTVLARYSLLLF